MEDQKALHERFGVYCASFEDAPIWLNLIVRPEHVQVRYHLISAMLRVASLQLCVETNHPKSGIGLIDELLTEKSLWLKSMPRTYPRTLVPIVYLKIKTLTFGQSDGDAIAIIDFNRIGHAFRPNIFQLKKKI